MILATKKHAVDSSVKNTDEVNDTQIVLDADLSVLGRVPHGKLIASICVFCVMRQLNP